MESFIEKWMYLETVIQSEVSQRRQMYFQTRSGCWQDLCLHGFKTEGLASCSLSAKGCHPPPGVAHIPCHVGFANLATSLLSQQRASLE